MFNVYLPLGSALASNGFFRLKQCLTATLGVALLALGSQGPTVAAESDAGLIVWGGKRFDFREFDQPITHVAAGSSNTVALKSDGTVIAWGGDAENQAQVPAGVSGVTQLAVGNNHTLALKTGGTVVAWGRNNENQTTIPAGLSGVVAVAAGAAHSVALKGDGTVVAWGSNAQGQTAVPAGLTGVTAITAGAYFTAALKGDGTVTAWGNNNYSLVTLAAGQTNVVAISAGVYHMVALKGDGTVVVWGNNSYGQKNVPAGLGGVVAIKAGSNHTLALKSDGTVVAWGDDGAQSVPLGLTGVIEVAAGTAHSVALRSDGSLVTWGGGSYDETLRRTNLDAVVALSSSDSHTLALKGDGTVLAWGRNTEGQVTVPASLSGVIEVAAGHTHSVALKNDGTVVAWGNSGNGRTAVPALLSGVSAIAAGAAHTVALKGDGTVVAWGLNTAGQCTVPAGLSGVIAIAAGSNHTLALKGDGTVVAWGDNTFGQRTIPAGLSGVTAIASGFYNNVALKTDGTLVGWGRNTGGEANVPAGLTGVVSLDIGSSHTLALKSDGTVVTWGKSSAKQSVVLPGLSRIRAIAAGNTHNTVLMELEATAPEIAVAGNGVEIISGDAEPATADHTSFGTTSVNGGLVERTFTITNSGNEALTLVGTGPHYVTLAGSSDFSVTMQPVGVVPVSGTTTFTISFNPSIPGVQTATVSIANDDASENPFTFMIEGSGTMSGGVMFHEPVYRVEQGALSMQVRVEHTFEGLPFEVTLETEDGTSSVIPPFAAALAGSDYSDLSGAATKVSFAAGETSKVVTIPLFPKTGAAQPNKRFIATLSAPTNGAALGTLATATLQILAGDTVKPTLTVTTPTAAATAISAPSPYVIKGSAGDAKGIDRIEIVLNGAAPLIPEMGPATTNTARPFSLPIEPVEGANTLVVTVFDLKGNSSMVTRNFSFTQRQTLSVARGAPEGVLLDAAGTVALAATPATAASALAPATANSNPRSSGIVPGTPVKLTATPKTGYVFSHWSGVPSGASSAGNVITFTMPGSDVAVVTANFVANPFHGAVGSSNVFYGLIHPEAGTASSNTTEGFITGTLTPASGAFSGKVVIDGVSQSFVAYFQGNGGSYFNVGTTKPTELSFGGRTLALNFNSGALTATVTQGSQVSVGTATRGLHSAANKVPAGLLNQTVPATAPAPNKGFFTMGLPAKTQDPVVALDAYPQGACFATVTVSELGLVTLSGTLADGTLVTGASGLVAGDECPILVQLTTPGAAATVKGGCFSGVLSFDAARADSDVSGTDLVWFRPAVSAVTTPAAAAAATNLYTAGWPNGIRVDAVGALYDKAVTVETGLGLGAPNAAAGNGELVFVGGKLTGEIVKTSFNVTGNVVSKTPDPVKVDGSYTLTLTAATGGFGGTFTPNWLLPNTTKPVFKGIVIQKGGSKGGYGFFISNAKSDLDPESGAVTLGGQ